MPRGRKKDIIPKEQLLLKLPPNLILKLQLELWSEVEQCIPRGAQQKFFINLLNEYFDRKEKFVNERGNRNENGGVAAEGRQPNDHRGGDERGSEDSSSRSPGSSGGSGSLEEEFEQLWDPTNEGGGEDAG